MALIYSRDLTESVDEQDCVLRDDTQHANVDIELGTRLSGIVLLCMLQVLRSLKPHTQTKQKRVL